MVSGNVLDTHPSLSSGLESMLRVGFFFRFMGGVGGWFPKNQNTLKNILPF